MCTSVLKEVVGHYNKNSSNVYVCMIDASKAFDKIKYGKLFKTILKRDMPGVVIRFLFDSYTRQYTYVRWGSALSDVVQMANGVKQGAVLSATLFCVYMDELTERLRNSGIGCYIGHKFYGCLSYADDLIILCPSVKGLQKMVKICEEFGLEYCVTYNSKKTIAMTFGIQFTPDSKISLNGAKLAWEQQSKYLGNYLQFDLDDDYDIRMKLSSFFGNVNRVINQFRGAPAHVRVRLLHTYCSAWYGSQTWLLQSQSVNRVRIEWNKAVRRVLGVSSRTRTRLLPYLAGTGSIEQQLHSRWCKMYTYMLSSKNASVMYIAQRQCV